MVQFPTSVRVETASRAAPASRVAPRSRAVAVVAMGEDEIARALFAGVKRVRMLGDPPSVYHLRVLSQAQAMALPDLAHGSRMADAVRVALVAGAPTVDLLVLAEEERFAVATPSAVVALSELLDASHEGILLFPDLGRGEAPDPTREAELLQTALLAWSPALVERFQVMLLDLPAWSADLEMGVLSAALGMDVGLSRFIGKADRIGGQGWRSAAAALAGLLCADPDPAAPLLGRSLPLPEPRAMPPTRMELLRRLPTRYAVEADPGRICALDLVATDRARAVSDPSFRRPVGTWSLAALRTAKSIHRALREAAQTFVFRGATEADAMALAVGLDSAAAPWVRRGMLVGPGPNGGPRIVAEVDREPGQWGLLANLEATLRPWNQRLRVQLTVAGAGGARSVEEAA